MLKSHVLKRIALGFGIAGVGLMGADLMITRNFFTHVAELMAASIICFVVALLLDRWASKQKEKENF